MAAALKKAKSLSRRQEQILDFIETFLNQNAYPPTIREIQKELDISSTSVVDYNLNALEERGYIRRNRHISRGIELFGFSAAQPSNVVSIPVVGRIAAGEPIEVPEDYAAGEFAESVTMPISMLPKATDGLFALRVRGHSMVDALINDGDLVILKPQLTADNGDTVAVWLKNERETTLKRFYREGARVRLQPANVTMQPIYTDATNVAVQGKLVGVIRAVENRFYSARFIPHRLTPSSTSCSMAFLRSIAFLGLRSRLFAPLLSYCERHMAAHVIALSRITSANLVSSSRNRAIHSTGAGGFREWGG